MTTDQEYPNLLSSRPEMNADMGIVIPAEKIRAWSLPGQLFGTEKNHDEEIREI